MSIKTIFEGKNKEELVKFADAKGCELASIDLSVSQVRNVLDAIQAMKQFDPGELQLLRPKLAYAAGKLPRIRPFRDVLDEAIGYVKSDDDFKLFRSLVEALVAYHALYESERRAERRGR
jgi:CRISPR-associated protein Csm2